MPQISANNKRIAKNTMMLYIRMFFMMVVSLYATRIVLHALGEENYGIYNVVGSIVVMFAFLSRVLATASQRYFAFELGRNNYDRLKQVFSITQILYIIIIIIIIVASEIFGLWFLHNKATIPPERMGAAGILFQISIISFSVSLFASPYQASIIAHERMDIYAYIGILDALLQLTLALSLKYIPYSGDILVVYGLLVLTSTILVNGGYVLYSLKHYSESRFRFSWDSKLAREILSYSGWNLFGTLSGVVRSQGINMLINAFFNPAINAARGIAYQVNNAVNQFANNFYTAVRPQVTKNYAKGDMSATMSLVFNSSRMTYYLLLCVAVPIMVFISPILDLWLTIVPSYTAMFANLLIVVALIDSLSNPLMTLVQATGKVSTYQAIVGTLLLMNLPISYIFLKLGYPAEYTMYTEIGLACVALIARLVILRNIIGFPMRRYIVQVLFKVSVPTILSFILVILLGEWHWSIDSSLVNLLLKLMLSVIITVAIIFCTGFNKGEKSMLIDIVSSKIRGK